MGGGGEHCEYIDRKKYKLQFSHIHSSAMWHQIHSGSRLYAGVAIVQIKKKILLAIVEIQVSKIS